MHILLIEPDSLQARIYGRALTRTGYTVAHARSAQHAVSLADEHTPDVVVLELQLPGHNGVEFLYEFRSYTEWMSIPMIIHTFVPLHDLREVTTLQNQLGVKRVLYKPTTTLNALCIAVSAIVPALP